jgi:hypothetical protein
MPMSRPMTTASTPVDTVVNPMMTRRGCYSAGDAAAFYGLLGAGLLNAAFFAVFCLA